ncbi:MAG: calcium-binding protein [Methyloceanibacter sp.]|uniref:calcium-binding protein n=1 Tax=Methyloceanibacter sp. TaxID=1965321 RepID=UPI003D6CB89A
MPIQFLNGNTYGPYSGDVPDIITVDLGATVHATGAGTAALNLGSGAWELNLYGKVTADDGHAVNLKDAGTFYSTIDVGRDAEISGGGSSGIGIAAAHSTSVSNSGSIKGGSTGILASGEDFGIFNSGAIEGGRYGIRSLSDTHQILNAGTISGGEYAILGGSGVELVVNIGTVNGNVHLGDGNDIFQNFIKDSEGDGVVTGTIDLGKGDDEFRGGNNKETVRDGDGKDTISLGGGDDLWFGFLAGGDDGVDIVKGGTGIDTYDAGQSGVQGVAINLDTVAHGGHAASSADDFNASTAAESIFSFENALGTNFADVLYGSSSDNFLMGRDGDDKLSGLDGDDTLKGDAGMDTLTGGRGKDSLFGGVDADVFDFNSIKESVRGGSRDIIQDFQRGTDDIDLVDIDAKTGVSGNQKFTFIGKQDFHDKKGELRYEDKGAKVVVQGDVNGDGKADFEIMVKAGALSAGDFIL